MKVKVSIIVPVYKVEKYIKRCIDSIINQTYDNIEIILVDDESPDNCGMICEKYAKKDKRIKVYHKQNGGLSDARNYGLKYSKGEYIAYVDSDDYIEPQMIEILVDTIEKNKADIAMCGTKVVGDYSTYNNKWFDNDLVLNKEEALKALLENRVITSHAWNKLYRKEIIEKFPWPKGRLYEDIRIMHNVFKACNKIAISKEYLYDYYQREDSICNNKNITNEFEYVDAFIKRYEDIKNDSKEYEEICFAQVCIAISNFLIRNNLSKKDKNKYSSTINMYCKMLKKINVRNNNNLTKKEKLIIKFTLLFKTKSNKIYSLLKMKGTKNG